MVDYRERVFTAVAREECGMFGKGHKLFNLLGFEVRVDSSWIFLALLITWSLATGFFPGFNQNLSPETCWIMGAVGALGLFMSIVIHELAHSLVARRAGIPMRGITLFVFGGVAEMSEEPPNPETEFRMAIIGPVSSVILGVVFLGIFRIGMSADWPDSFNGVTAFISWINITLAVFNLIPAFPLDGGRVLRAFLWWIKGDQKWATRISSWIGAAFGILLMILGALGIIAGDIIGGIWKILIGLFLQGAAQSSYQQLILRKAFEGIPVRRFMTEHPVTVPPSITIKELVDSFIYRYHFKMFPVVDDNVLFGCIGTRQVKELPPDEWGRRLVADMAVHCSEDSTIEPDDDAVKALDVMSRTGIQRLMVVHDGVLMGVISLKDLLEFFSLKMELEDRD